MTSNVDPKEIQNFEAVANDWWELDGALKTLHIINPVRLQFIEQHTSLSGKKVLDVGCGGGILAESLAQAGAEVTGIDMSSKALKCARQHAKHEKISIHYEEITAEAFAEKAPQTFDIITCMELLEHVPDPQSIIKACAQLVKPGGQIFFSTLNRTLKAYVFAILGAEYLFKLLPKGLHTYEKFIRPSELSAWARAEGLEISQISGFSYNPITQGCALCKNAEVNYIAMYMAPGNLAHQCE